MPWLIPTTWCSLGDLCGIISRARHTCLWDIIQYSYEFSILQLKEWTTLSYCIFLRTLYTRYCYYHGISEETFVMRVGKWRCSFQSHEAKCQCSAPGQVLTPSPWHISYFSVDLYKSNQTFGPREGVLHKLHEVGMTRASPVLRVSSCLTPINCRLLDSPHPEHLNWTTYLPQVSFGKSLK